MNDHKITTSQNNIKSVLSPHLNSKIVKSILAHVYYNYTIDEIRSKFNINNNTLNAIRCGYNFSNILTNEDKEKYKYLTKNTKEIIKYKISYSEYGLLMDELTNLIKIFISNTFIPKKIYGFPRGALGMIIHISNHLNIDITNDLDKYSNYLLVDDICDSGKTLTNATKKLKSRNINFITATLFKKPRANIIPNIYIEEVFNNVWVEFPWEGEDSEIDKDYMFEGNKKEN